jgi:hypothetical protein
MATNDSPAGMFPSRRGLSSSVDEVFWFIEASAIVIGRLLASFWPLITFALASSFPTAVGKSGQAVDR